MCTLHSFAPHAQYAVDSLDLVVKKEKRRLGLRPFGEHEPETSASS